MVTVALPEEMPVNETLDFQRELRREMGMKLDAVVVNALYPTRFTDGEAERIEQAADSNGSPGVRAALRAALFEHHRAQQPARRSSRLAKELGRRPWCCRSCSSRSSTSRSFES